MPECEPDLEKFRVYCTWFARGQDFSVRSGPRPATDAAFRPTADFTRRFPTLTVPLSRARVTEFDVGDKRYHLYSWTADYGETIGWLCLPPARIIRNAWLLPDHQLLLGCFGGIVEPWDGSEDWTLLANHYDILTEDACEVGIRWENHYRFVCELYGMTVVVDPAEYAAFAFEGDGDLTAYQLGTGRVVMFAHDHSFDHIDVFEGCPDDTFYTIRDCPDFRTWVETVAKQWLDLLEPTSAV
jgi:hypothetical protein